MLLEAQNLTVRFGGLEAVKNASVGIEAREVFTIIGPNGAGKTTLINALTGFLCPTAGKVFFAGREITGKEPHQVALLGLVRTFQQNQLFWRSTVRQNILIGTHLLCGGRHCLPRTMESLSPVCQDAPQAAREIVEEVLELVGLAAKATWPAASLPHGEQRLLGMAVALAARPQLLFLDEPVGGMTATEAERVMGLIDRIKNSGITIGLIEHNMNFVMSVSDRIVVLDHGEVIAAGKPEDIQQNPRVIEAYLGRW